MRGTSRNGKCSPTDTGSSSAKKDRYNAPLYKMLNQKRKNSHMYIPTSSMIRQVYLLLQQNICILACACKLVVNAPTHHQHIENTTHRTCYYNTVTVTRAQTHTNTLRSRCTGRATNTVTVTWALTYSLTHHLHIENKMHRTCYYNTVTATRAHTLTNTLRT